MGILTPFSKSSGHIVFSTEANPKEDVNVVTTSSMRLITELKKKEKVDPSLEKEALIEESSRKEKGKKKEVLTPP